MLLDHEKMKEGNIEGIEFLDLLGQLLVKFCCSKN